MGERVRGRGGEWRWCKGGSKEKAGRLFKVIEGRVRVTQCGRVCGNVQFRQHYWNGLRRCGEGDGCSSKRVMMR